MSKNPLTIILEANKLNGNNYNDWLRSLNIILDFETQTYALDQSPPASLPEDSSAKERVMFEKWHDDDRKVCSIILTSMTIELHVVTSCTCHAVWLRKLLKELLILK
ncbi:UNVERIFIED_CONTAM: hypothetical protein Sradi_5263600 [Sesamum radiatum]|uniref:Retrotransposon Copia-like N-terminal domain-containing protein n=1 Tax=Sesamum radiatum TaxID=300843 RepID=A0AAW2LQN5_SESRA